MLFFSTASPPAVIAATLKSLDLIEQNSDLRHRLFANVQKLRDGLKSVGVPVGGTPSPIVPVMIGSEEKASQLSQKLFDNGFWVPAIRYPTVAKRKARLRLTISAAHQPEDIERLVTILKREIV